MEDRDDLRSLSLRRPAPITRCLCSKLTFLRTLVFLTGPTTTTDNSCFANRTTAGVRLEASPLRRVSDF